MSSLAVLVPEYFWNWMNRTMIIGTPVSVCINELRIGSICIELTNRPLWNGSLTLDLIDGFNLKKLSFFKEGLLRLEKRTGFVGLIRKEGSEDPFVGKCTAILERITVTRSRNEQMIVQGLSPLVGLGIGLTPSGDDFLTGALLGERVSLALSRTHTHGKGQKEPMKVLRMNKAEILGALEKTSLPGKTLLWQALWGQFPSYLLHFVRAVATSSNSNDIDKHIAEAGRHGETSGTDAVVGLYWFLSLSYEAEALGRYQLAV